MNIKQWTATGIILGLITISMPVASAAETGWYIGGGTGYSSKTFGSVSLENS